MALQLETKSPCQNINLVDSSDLLLSSRVLHIYKANQNSTKRKALKTVLTNEKKTTFYSKREEDK